VEWINEKDDRDRGIGWTAWDTFFGLKFEREMNERELYESMKVFVH